MIEVLLRFRQQPNNVLYGKNRAASIFFLFPERSGAGPCPPRPLRRAGGSFDLPQAPRAGIRGPRQSCPLLGVGQPVTLVFTLTPGSVGGRLFLALPLPRGDEQVARGAMVCVGVLAPSPPGVAPGPSTCWWFPRQRFPGHWLPRAFCCP